jgi:hypothetical protein
LRATQRMVPAYRTQAPRLPRATFDSPQRRRERREEAASTMAPPRTLRLRGEIQRVAPKRAATTPPGGKKYGPPGGGPRGLWVRSGANIGWAPPPGAPWSLAPLGFSAPVCGRRVGFDCGDAECAEGPWWMQPLLCVLCVLCVSAVNRRSLGGDAALACGTLAPSAGSPASGLQRRYHPLAGRSPLAGDALDLPRRRRVRLRAGPVATTLGPAAASA